MQVSRGLSDYRNQNKKGKTFMKKILAIVTVICLVASLLCVGASAGTLSSDDVLRIYGVKSNGTSVIIDGSGSFEEGWEKAVDFAEDHDYLEDKGFDRIMVELLADWNADEDGEFGSGGDGFEWNTIDIPGDTRMTINMNGHTIDRGLEDDEFDGEVIHISIDADVIINNGTIKGGWSENGGGGLNIGSDANVILNNVNIVGNNSSRGGGGVRVGDDATLTVNGGSFVNNLMRLPSAGANVYKGGAVSVDGGVAVFNGVEFKDNDAPSAYNFGAAIFVDDGEVTINECIFAENGIKRGTAFSIVQGMDSVIRVNGSTFTGNGGETTAAYEYDYSAVFVLENSDLIMDSSEFVENTTYFLISDEENSLVQVSNTKFVNNKSAVMRGNEELSNNSFFRKCTFENNGNFDGYSFCDITSILTFYDCSMGESNFSGGGRIGFVDNVPESDSVLSISALKRDGTTESIGNYNNFEKGWNAAMELAADSDAMAAKGYDRVVVDIHYNWNADAGQFDKSLFNGKGFDWDAIYFQPGVRMTLNLNGNTIDRGLDEWQENGEVICIDDNADVIINNGTITGGNSGNGAGGIHINDGANVTLNNVHIVGNVACADDGAGIAVYDGATLTVNGGSFRDNVVHAGDGEFCSYYGTVYVEDSIAVFNNVEFKHNGAVYAQNVINGKGVAIYGNSSRITVDNCTFDGNGVEDEAYGFSVAYSTLEFEDCDVTVKNSTFTNDSSTCLIKFDSSALNVEDCAFTKNKNNILLSEENYSALCVSDTQFDDNRSRVFVDGPKSVGESYFKNCKFGNNSLATTCDFELRDTVAFYECQLGDATFEGPEHAVFVNTETPENFPSLNASIFGEGSLTNILVIISLVTSVVSISLTISFNKKKRAKDNQ